MHIRQCADIARPALARCARRRWRELPREGPAGPQARPLHPDGCPRPGLRPTLGARWPRAVRIRKQEGKTNGPGCGGLRCGCWRCLLGPAPGWRACNRAKPRGRGLNAGPVHGMCMRCSNGPGQALAHLPPLARAAAGAGGARRAEQGAWRRDGAQDRTARTGGHGERMALAHACRSCCLIEIRGGLPARGVGGGVSY